MSNSAPSGGGWEPPSPEELQAMLPQYEISEIIGRGGMGAVYKGRQAKLNRPVAIKLLPETFSKGGDELNFAKRFEQEAQAMANLDHPAIISVYDFGETDTGQLYFVMEFVDGMDVHQYLQHHGGNLPQESAITITAHVLDALDYAHSHGIAHRDIKPANILLNHEGRVKIADFGLAKKFGDAADASAPALTISNIAVGTPDFVAPEALDIDQTPDHRADLYAVGVMLYQMLTGKLPRGFFQEPSELDAQIDARLDDIVSKAMAANPDHRYQSAAAVRADLDVVLSQPLARVVAGDPSGVVAAAVPVTTSVRGGKAVTAKSKMPLYVGLGVGVVAVGIGAIAWFGGRGKEDVTRLSNVESTPSERAAAPSVEVRATPATTVEVVEAPKPETPKPVVVEPPQKIVAPESVEPPDKTLVPPPNAPEPVATPVVAKAENTTAPPPAPAAADSAPLSPSPSSPPILPPELAALDTQFLELKAERVTGPHEADLANLNSGYLGGIAKKIAQEKSAGDLDGILALEAEQKRITAKEPVPETDGADTPESLKTLRAIYREEHAKLVAAREENLQDLTGPLDTHLAQMETDFTKADRLDDAKTVRGYREVLSETVGKADGLPLPITMSSSAGGAPGSRMTPSDPALARASKDTPFENSLGMKFVPVPGTGVLFCIHEVRYKDYEEYAKKAKENVDGTWETQTNDGFEIKKNADDHPVTCVNWDDAQKFCSWLSEKEDKTYRLPTDQEWSLAVGIGREEDWKDDTTPATVFKVPDVFPWGDEWPPPAGAGNYSDESRRAKAPLDIAKYVEGGYDDGFPTTAPVMSFEPNKLGIFDLGGNVREWCEDWLSVTRGERVLRGGSWGADERDILLSSGRPRASPVRRHGDRGCRVVLVPSVSGP